MAFMYTVRADSGDFGLESRPGLIFVSLYRRLDSPKPDSKWFDPTDFGHQLNKLHYQYPRKYQITD